MKVLSLFSGVGLGDYGLELAGMEIVGQVEVDDYCQKILALRWPDVPKWRDIKTLDTKELPPIDLVAGGFPCQPFSVAGKRKGKDDDRNLWPQMLRVIREVSPTWVLAENVPGIIPSYLDQVLSDLEAEGYAWEAVVFPAHALGAPHRRDRLWIVGHARLFGQTKHEVKTMGIEQSSQDVADSEHNGQSQTKGKHTEDKQHKGRSEESESVEQSSGSGSRSDVSKNVSHSERERLRRWEVPIDRGHESENQQNWDKGGSKTFKYLRLWETEPNVGRVVDVCPNRVDRLKALGNGQVVACAQWVGSQIMKMEVKKL